MAGRLRHLAATVGAFVGLAAVLVGGTVVIELIFSLPGMGRFVLDLLNNRDFVPIQSIVLLMALTVMFLNLLVDISYAWIDPRIRYR